MLTELYTPAQRHNAAIWRRIDTANDLGAGWSVYVPKDAK